MQIPHHLCSSDVLIDGVFMRNSDDCIAIYGHRWKYYGDVKNVAVRNSSLWADLAHPIMVGTHGDSDNPDTIEHLEFSNIDILDHHEAQTDYQGCMSLDAGDSNLIRDVRFENIRVEDFRQGAGVPNDFSESMTLRLRFEFLSKIAAAVTAAPMNERV